MLVNFGEKRGPLSAKSGSLDSSERDTHGPLVRERKCLITTMATKKYVRGATGEKPTLPWVRARNGEGIMTDGTQPPVSLQNVLLTKI